MATIPPASVRVCAKDAYLLGLGGLGSLLLTGLGVGLPLLEESLGDEDVVSRRDGAVDV